MNKIMRKCLRPSEKWTDREIVPVVAKQLTIEDICRIIHEVTDTKHTNSAAVLYQDPLPQLH